MYVDSTVYISNLLSQFWALYVRHVAKCYIIYKSIVICNVQMYIVHVFVR